MITIHKSNNYKYLSGALCRSLDRNADSDPLAGHTIVVPNRDTAGWLKRFIAEQNGIAANIEFLLPAEWQWRMVRELYPDLPKVLPTDRLPIFWTLYELLLNRENSEQFPQLKRYLENRESSGREEAVRQLAHTISSVFDQYLNYRPEMILKWQSGKTGTGEEKWQADLWNLLQDHWQSRFGEKSPINRAELQNEAEAALADGSIKPEKQLWVFNPGLIPKPVVKLLEAYGKVQNLEFYLMLPAVQNENSENELLTAFGHDANRTDGLFALESTPELNFDTGKPDHILESIRLDIAENRKLSGSFSPEDRKERIRIKSCHSPLREMEVLHQFLLEQFEKNEKLNPEDVLVVMPDLHEYQPVIDAVFGSREEQLPHIPWHIGLYGNSGQKESLRVFRQMLVLPESRFEFGKVMELFLAEPVHTHFGISGAEAEMIRRWMEENNVIWGLDGKHRQELGQPGSDLQTWKAAIRSTWLGQWMGTYPGETVNGTLLYTAIDGTSKKDAWAAFSRYLSILERFKRETKKNRAPADWCTVVEEWFRLLVGEKEFGQMVYKLLSDTGENSKAADVETMVPYSIIRSELEAVLETQMAGTARFSNGVVFSSMVPVRSIPFKVIALVGLSEERFPRRTISPGFDLTVISPGPADRNRKEEDRNLFLESLLAAEEVHYCSFVGQNRMDNEELAVSSVVSEWTDILGRLTGEKPEEIIEKESLTSLSIVNFSEKKSYSVTELDTAKRLFSGETGVAGLQFQKSFPADDELSQGFIELNRLQSFFSNPVRNFMKAHFELRLPDEESDRDEFDLDNLQQHLLFQRVFGWKLQDRSADEILELMTRSGAVPGGWPGRKKINEMLSNAGRAADMLNEKGFRIGQTSTRLDFKIDQFRVQGIVNSWSPDLLLDITASKGPERTLIKTWLGYLTLLCSGVKSEAEILYSLKKDPKWIRFKPVENPKELLSEILEFYRQSVTQLPYSFPKTSFAFDEAERKGEDAVSKAKVAFEGSDFNKFTEASDHYVKLVLGANPEFNESFTKGGYQQIIKTLNDHTEEG